MIQLNDENKTHRVQYLVVLARNRTLDLSEALAVFDAANGALLELHYVLRQSACLVAEHVFNLPQLLRQVRRSALRGSVRIGEIDVPVDLRKGVTRVARGTGDGGGGRPR